MSVTIITELKSQRDIKMINSQMSFLGQSPLFTFSLQCVYNNTLVSPCWVYATLRYAYHWGVPADNSGMGVKVCLFFLWCLYSLPPFIDITVQRTLGLGPSVTWQHGCVFMLLMHFIWASVAARGLAWRLYFWHVSPHVPFVCRSGLPARRGGNAQGICHFLPVFPEPGSVSLSSCMWPTIRHV